MRLPAFLVLSACFAANGNPRVLLKGEDSLVAEATKILIKSCPGVSVTTVTDGADYSVLVADDGSGAARRGRRAVVSNSTGKVVMASSTRAFSSSIKNACEAMQKDWKSPGK
jgi:hypothetical protein